MIKSLVNYYNRLSLGDAAAPAAPAAAPESVAPRESSTVESIRARFGRRQSRRTMTMTSLSSASGTTGTVSAPSSGLRTEKAPSVSGSASHSTKQGGVKYHHRRGVSSGSGLSVGSTRASSGIIDPIAVALSSPSASSCESPDLIEEAESKAQGVSLLLRHKSIPAVTFSDEEALKVTTSETEIAAAVDSSKPSETIVFASSSPKDRVSDLVALSAPVETEGSRRRKKSSSLFDLEYKSSIDEAKISDNMTAKLEMVYAVSDKSYSRTMIPPGIAEKRKEKIRRRKEKQMVALRQELAKCEDEVKLVSSKCSSCGDFFEISDFDQVISAFNNILKTLTSESISVLEFLDEFPVRKVRLMIEARDLVAKLANITSDSSEEEDARRPERRASASLPPTESTVSHSESEAFLPIAELFTEAEAISFWIGQFTPTALQLKKEFPNIDVTIGQLGRATWNEAIVKKSESIAERLRIKAEDFVNFVFHEHRVSKEMSKNSRKGLLTLKQFKQVLELFSRHDLLAEVTLLNSRKWIDEKVARLGFEVMRRDESYSS